MSLLNSIVWFTPITQTHATVMVICTSYMTWRESVSGCNKQTITKNSAIFNLCIYLIVKIHLLVTLNAGYIYLICTLIGEI